MDVVCGGSDRRSGADAPIGRYEEIPLQGHAFHLHELSGDTELVSLQQLAQPIATAQVDGRCTVASRLTLHLR
jgi:hypothetical protein